MALADVVHESQEPSAKTYTKENYSYFDERLESLAAVCREELKSQGFEDDSILFEYYLHMRYDGTDCALMCSPQSSKTSTKHGDFLKTFVNRYQTEFGFTIQNRSVIVDDIRVRGIGKSLLEQDVGQETATIEPKYEKSVKVFFDGGYQDSKVYLLAELLSGHVIYGPAIIMDNLSTILVEPDCTAFITKFGDVKISIGTGKIKEIGPELDSIQLSIFSHRFMSIAEQMGR